MLNLQILPAPQGATAGSIQGRAVVHKGSIQTLAASMSPSGLRRVLEAQGLRQSYALSYWSECPCFLLRKQPAETDLLMSQIRTFCLNVHTPGVWRFIPIISVLGRVKEESQCEPEACPHTQHVPGQPGLQSTHFYQAATMSLFMPIDPFTSSDSQHS